MPSSVPRGRVIVRAKTASLATGGIRSVSRLASSGRKCVATGTVGNSILKLAADLNVAQEAARKSRSGMWRYGDVDEDDEDVM